MSGAEDLARRISAATSLRGVVRTMKAVSAASLIVRRFPSSRSMGPVPPLVRAGWTTLPSESVAAM